MHAGNHQMEVVFDAEDASTSWPEHLPQHSPTGPGSLAFTSGTTGPAKAIFIPTDLHQARVACAATVFKWTSHDIVGLFVPLTTSTGTFGESAAVLGFLPAWH